MLRKTVICLFFFVVPFISLGYSSDPELSVEKDLFAISFSEEAADVKRICEKADVVQAYGKTDWDELSVVLKDVLIDLRLRGDYTPASRKLNQEHVAESNFDKFSAVLQDKNSWPNVPKVRFERRGKYLNVARISLRTSTCPQEGSNADAKRVIGASEKRWEANKSDCNNFLKAVAVELGINDFKPEWNADRIIEHLETVPAGWTKLNPGDNVGAFNAAVDGKFVVAGLTSKDMMRNNGHVSVVVASEMVASGSDGIKYPKGYWGTLGGTGEKCKGLNFSFPSPYRKSIRYYYRDVPPAT